MGTDKRGVSKLKFIFSKNLIQLLGTKIPYSAKKLVGLYSKYLILSFIK